MSTMHPAISHNFEKMGFYPTDDRTLSLIKNAIEPNLSPQTIILDPCCGEGLALKNLQKGLCPNAKSYGVELDEARFDQSKHCIDHVLHADALNQVKYSRSSVSMLFLNPPYGQSSISSRLEYAFIKKYIHALMPNGLLLLVIPIQAFDYKLAQYLCSHCDDVSFGLSPEQAFKQVIFIGRKIKMSQGKRVNDDAKRIIHAIERRHLCTPPRSLYQIPEAKKNFELMSLNITAKGVNELINSKHISTLWNSFERDFTRLDNNYRRPLTQLSDWHTAQAIISGMISGLVESEHRRMLIKGTVNKTLSDATVTEDADTEHYQQIERFVPIIIGIDVTQGSDNFGEIYQIN